MRRLLLALAGAALMLPALVTPTALAAATAAPTLTIVPSTLGNTFTAGQQVTLGFSTDASTMSWTVRDAAGTEVARGSATAASLNGRLALAISTPGWYQVDLKAFAADGSEKLGGTDFAVLGQHDFSTSTDTRIGVASGLGFSSPGNPGNDAVSLLATGGISTARDEAFWASAETTPGVIQFPQKVLDYKAALDANHVDFLNILDYGNPCTTRTKHPPPSPSARPSRATPSRPSTSSAPRTRRTSSGTSGTGAT